MSESIYLDNHSSTAPCSAALDRMASCFTDGAIFSSHRRGKELKDALDGRVQTLYEFVGASFKDQLAFTASGGAAVQQVFWSVFFSKARKEGRSHFITSVLEDAPALMGLKRLEDLGCYVKIAPATDQGQINVDKLADLMGPRTALVSISSVQGLTGVLQPLDAIIELCRKKGVLLHVDVSYSAGKVSIDFEGIDYLTFDGNRLHSVWNSACVFAKEGRPLFPLFPGDHGVDVPGIVALSAAVQQAELYTDVMGLEVARLRDLFESRISALIPEAQILWKESLRLPNVSLIALPPFHAEAILYFLNQKGVYATMGGGQTQLLSRLLIACGVEDRIAQSSLSFSLSRKTTQLEIERASTALKEAVDHLRLYYSEKIFSC